MTGRTSMKTVAAAAGVSLATVSNAYNRPDRLSAAVRERVLAIADAQGYPGPDPAARSLRRGRSGAIGVVFAVQLSYAFTDPYCTELLAGIADVAELSRTSLLLMPLVPVTATCDDEQVRQSIDAARHAVVDGVVTEYIDETHPVMDVLRSRGLPLVRSIEGTGDRCVVVDDECAMRAVGEHLASLGHRSVAVVATAPGVAGTVEVVRTDRSLYPYARLRVTGLRSGLGRGADVTIVRVRDNTAAAGRLAAELIARQLPEVTAVAAVSDVLALGVLDGTTADGPHRLAVTGFDDVPSAAARGLTTVRQPIREKGRAMARMLLDPASSDERVVLPIELVVRASTAAASRATPAASTPQLATRRKKNSPR